MFNVTICWDNRKQTKILTKYLTEFSLYKDFSYNLSITSSFDDILDSNSNHIDILLLYIKLHDKDTAFNTYKKIKSVHDNIQVIFILDTVDFMINGFALKDFPYLLQPLNYECFEEEMLACSKHLHFKIDDCHLDFMSSLSSKTILFIESLGNNCVVFTNQSTINIPYNISYVEKFLTSSSFFRCHDDYIINLKRLNRIGKHYVIIKDNEIPVCVDKFEDLKSRLLSMFNLL